MFKSNDRIIFSLINAKDINGNILPFNLTLPFTEEIDFSLLKDAVSLDFLEYYASDVKTEYPARKVFSIYIGNYSNISTLYAPHNNLKKDIKKGVQITTITSPVCYQRQDNTQVVFASLKPGDILVNNLEELTAIIYKLNSSVENIYKEIDNVKKLSRIPLKNNRKKNKNAH